MISMGDGLSATVRVLLRLPVEITDTVSSTVSSAQEEAAGSARQSSDMA